MKLHQTLYNTGTSALVRLELKQQGVSYSARVCSIAAVAEDRCQQQQLCSAHAIAISLPHSMFMPACVKSLQDNRITAEILDTDAVCTVSHLMFPQPLNETSAVHVAACVVAALEQLHQRSIIFRALAPSTIAVDTNGLAQLVDTRFLKQLQSPSDRTYTLCGDPCYASPEMLQGQGYSCAADYWSLGVLIFYLLDGHVPFQGSTGMQTSALQFPPHFSSAAIDLLQSLLCGDITRRLGEKDGDHLRIKSHRFFQDIDWVAGAEQDITSPHAFTHRIAHCQCLAVQEFAAEVCSSDLSWFSDF